MNTNDFLFKLIAAIILAGVIVAVVTPNTKAERSDATESPALVLTIN